MKAVMASTAIVVAAVSAGLAAQAAKDMSKPMMKNDKMMHMTYTGCVEAANHGATFMLTHVADPAMKSHAMMKGDTMAKKDPTPMDDMKKTDMVKAMTLTGRTDLKKHVGQKVTVMGSVADGSMGAAGDDLSTLMVSSLKVIAKSCS